MDTKLLSDKKINNSGKAAFFQILRELMAERNLNISQLAEETKIPRTSINNWLNGQRSPNIDYLVILAKYFDCSVDYMLGLEDVLGNKLF